MALLGDLGNHDHYLGNHLQIMINTRVLAHPASNLTFRWVFSKGEERADIEQVRGDLVDCHDCHDDDEDGGDDYDNDGLQQEGGEGDFDL